ncbi:hypothetical protein MAPG_02858 [Magnaporthiopsis poae ATCC 64411]|uniref:Uncharacterized protein n=1 Tax=Magnaporthiopsis poae (strain ATCC 64411 / 73-15) TaxID=644358 RepID=A0A0C4DSH7_MAGP6|nr:hypothetical protein MAPG_02858 [Magnaporthiopsis poae ATCC 64411]
MSIVSPADARNVEVGCASDCAKAHCLDPLANARRLISSRLLRPSARPGLPLVAPLLTYHTSTPSYWCASPRPDESSYLPLYDSTDTRGVPAKPQQDFTAPPQDFRRTLAFRVLRRTWATFPDPSRKSPFFGLQHPYPYWCCAAVGYLIHNVTAILVYLVSNDFGEDMTAGLCPSVGVVFVDFSSLLRSSSLF